MRFIADLTVRERLKAAFTDFSRKPATPNLRPRPRLPRTPGPAAAVAKGGALPRGLDYKPWIVAVLTSGFLHARWSPWARSGRFAPWLDRRWRAKARSCVASQAQLSTVDSWRAVVGRNQHPLQAPARRWQAVGRWQGFPVVFGACGRCRRLHALWGSGRGGREIGV